MNRIKFIIPILTLIIACSNRQSSKTNSTKNKEQEVLEVKSDIQYSKKDSLVLASINDSLAHIIKNEKLKISYLHDYNPSLYKTDFKGKYEGYISVQVDTTDFIAKIVKGRNSKYAVAGLNHIYKFYIKNGFNGNPISFQVDKKRDLPFLLERMDYWLESNLDVWSLISMRPKEKLIICEFNINPRYNYGDSYYFVFDTLGNIHNHGFNLSWGGDGADGYMRILGDKLITCNEIYDIKNDTVLFFTQSPTSCVNTKNMTEKEKAEYYSSIRTTHGMRVINDSTFLVVYNRPGKYLDKNGVIYSTTLDTIATFRYHGLMGEMDAKLLINDKFAKDSIVLLDCERKSLVFIPKHPPYEIQEIDSTKMIKKDKVFIENLDNTVIKNDFPEFIVKKDTEGNYYYYENEY